jgi:hypothetical protein
MIYVRVYDATLDETYLRVVTGDIPAGVTPLSEDEAKATGLTIRK